MVDLNKKRALFICKGHPNIAGAQRYLKYVSDCFPEESYELHYAYSFDDGSAVFNEIAEKRLVKTWDYDWRHLSFFVSFKYARSLIRKINPEFIIFNSNEDEIIPPILAARLVGIRNKIMVVHWALRANSLRLINIKGSFLPFPSRYAFKIRVKRCLAYLFLDKIIFVNNGTRTAFAKLYKVNTDKCKTIYNGIDVDTFCYSEIIRKRVRADLELNDDDIMILATGNLSPVKGHEVLIKAIANLVKQGKPVKCFIAGQGELQKQLKALIEQNKITMQCKLLGYRNDIPQLLSATDIFCMPSFNEALGYSLLEAMAVGRPVVASRVGGIPEVVTDSVDGVLVSSGSPEALSIEVGKLIDDSLLRFEMGKNGVHKVMDKFSNKNMIANTSFFLGLD